MKCEARPACSYLVNQKTIVHIMYVQMMFKKLCISISLNFGDEIVRWGAMKLFKFFHYIFFKKISCMSSSVLLIPSGKIKRESHGPMDEWMEARPAELKIRKRSKMSRELSTDRGISKGWTRGNEVGRQLRPTGHLFSAFIYESNIGPAVLDRGGIPTLGTSVVE